MAAPARDRSHEEGGLTMTCHRFARAGLGAVLIALVAACSHQIPLNPSAASVPAEPPVKETVGVYFSDEFRSFVHHGSYGGDSWIFPLGAASTPLFEQVFARVFEKTVPVTSLPPLGAEHADLAAVIEPRIEEFAFHIPFFKTQTFTASITYRFILHDARGEPVASWTVAGEGAKPGQIGFEFAKWPGQAADLAMEDAARKFSGGIRKLPEVRRWLMDRGLLISRLGRRANPPGGDGA